MQDIIGGERAASPTNEDLEDRSEKGYDVRQMADQTAHQKAGDETKRKGKERARPDQEQEWLPSLKKKRRFSKD